MIEPKVSNTHSSGFGPYWSCPVCNKRYGTKKQAESHILNKHKVKEV